MSPDKIQFAPWVPPDAQETCTNFYSVAKDSNFPESLKVLQRLAIRDDMKEAWAELTHFPELRPSDLISKTFLVWLCATRNRLARKFPEFESNRSDRGLALMARVVIDALRKDPAIREDASTAETTLRDLERVAASYVQRASYFDAFARIAPPSTKARVPNAAEIAFRLRHVRLVRTTYRTAQALHSGRHPRQRRI